MSLPLAAITLAACSAGNAPPVATEGFARSYDEVVSQLAVVGYQPADCLDDLDTTTCFRSEEHTDTKTAVEEFSGALEELGVNFAGPECLELSGLEGPLQSCSSLGMLGGGAVSISATFDVDSNGTPTTVLVEVSGRSTP